MTSIWGQKQIHHNSLFSLLSFADFTHSVCGSTLQIFTTFSQSLTNKTKKGHPIHLNSVNVCEGGKRNTFPCIAPIKMQITDWMSKR